MKDLSQVNLIEGFYKDDRTHWSPPKLSNVDWGSIDFLSWKHEKNGNYYLLMEQEDGDGVRGFVVEMNAGHGVNKNSCSLCHARNQDIGVKAAFIKTNSNPRRKIGIHVCGDLGCSHRVRGILPSIFPFETITVGRRIERLQERLNRLLLRLST
ncbi:MAG: FBP domain-containing protein [Pseudobacteriovorax sp.]|nr:FBP domain-containing protein [Pseudobacteriovorax sp.]